MREMNHDHAAASTIAGWSFTVCPLRQQMNIELFITPNTEIMHKISRISPAHFFQCTQQQWHQKEENSKRISNNNAQRQQRRNKRQRTKDSRKEDRAKEKKISRSSNFSFISVSLCGHSPPSSSPPPTHPHPFSDPLLRRPGWLAAYCCCWSTTFYSLGSACLL